MASFDPDPDRHYFEKLEARSISDATAANYEAQRARLTALRLKAVVERRRLNATLARIAMLQSEMLSVAQAPKPPEPARRQEV